MSYAITAESRGLVRGTCPKCQVEDSLLKQGMCLPCRLIARIKKEA